MIIDKLGNKRFKIGLHIHTTLSDGRVTPEESARIYKEAGFDAIAITDHWQYGGEGEISGLKILSGCEYNMGASDTSVDVMHIVGVGMKYAPDIKKEDERQHVIDEINKAGGIAILAHPAWSLNHPDEALCLKGFSAVEIYNSVSDANQSSRPYSGYFVDLIANKGMFLNIAATDDVHYYNGSDETKSYIMVKADSLDDVFEAIKNGDYYATQGPEVHVRREGDKLICDCSECVKIDFLSNAAWGPDRITRGKGLTHAQYQIKPFDKWVRVEVLDENGNYAWSNIIKI
jgi:predicted metal-dependent phosphoesterase TrpH